MPVFLIKMGNMLFGRHLEFRVRLFNILAFAGLLICPIFSVVGSFTGAGIFDLMLNIVIAALSVSLIWYSLVSGNYQRCYLITIIVIFFGMFPAFFIVAGGYKSGMPIFFVFAVLFTVFMLEGKKMIVLSVAEMVLYASLFVYAYHYPEAISHFNTEADVLVDIIMCFLVVSLALGITMSLHFKLYNQQQKELEAARKQAEEYAKMKGTLFAEMSHEMRTPLTVMSTYAQFAVEQIKEKGSNEQTLADLATISEEAKRLAEMADGTLKILLSTETGTTEKRAVMPVDIGDLAKRLIRLLIPVALRKGRKLTAHIEDGLFEINGDADGLTQLLWNVIQNSITYSHSDIKLTVQADGAGITITVKDDGEGIGPELLPHVFDWGVSGEKGGSGIGLSICRDIARRHGGDISVQSGGSGTCVTITLKGKAEGFFND